MGADGGRRGDEGPDSVKGAAARAHAWHRAGSAPQATWLFCRQSNKLQSDERALVDQVEK